MSRAESTVRCHPAIGWTSHPGKTYGCNGFGSNWSYRGARFTNALGSIDFYSAMLQLTA
jgi:hypothetical protein